MDNNIQDTFGEVIHSYTRAQAIEDGFLVDVSPTAKEAGFRFPVALTRAVWDRYVQVPEGVLAQDEAGRLWDVLTMCRYAIRQSTSGGDRLYFKLHVRNDNAEKTAPLVTLKSICGPGDEGEPTITILLPDED